MKKEEMVLSIIRQFEELTYHIENNNHSEESLLARELVRHEDVKHIQLSLTEYHIIACIGLNGMVNGTAISKTLNITKGGISKTAAKLIEKKLIKAKRLPNNKKEIHYYLTDLGKKIFFIHANMHKLTQEQLTKRLNTYTLQEMKVIQRFLSDFDTYESAE